MEKLNQLISKAKTEQIKEHVEIRRAKRNQKISRADAKKKSNEEKYAAHAHEIFDFGKKGPEKINND